MPRLDCSLHPDLRAGLAADLAPWRLRSITRDDLRSALSSIGRGESDITVSFGIYNNTLHWLQPASHPYPRSPHVYAVADDLRAILGMHTVPDVEFVLNVDDYPKAHRRIPLFSYCKRQRNGRAVEYDVLVPSGSYRMSNFEAKLLQRTPNDWDRAYPWQRKKPTAFFRGTPYCGQHAFGRCSRYAIPHLAQRSRSPLLDVGLVEYNPRHDTELSRQEHRRHGSTAHARGAARARGAEEVGAGSRQEPPLEELRKVERVADSVYGEFRYLLHLDGHSFSNRLQTLLLTNSLVLKQVHAWPPYVSPYVSAISHVSRSSSCRRASTARMYLPMYLPCISLILMQESHYSAYC